MPARPTTAALAAVAVLAVALAACGKDSPGTGGGGTGRTIRVPADAPTIAAAVGKARAGDLVLISPGTYAEAVEVEVPRITVRGLDRNTVILDGGHRLANGITVVADGVAVENLTARNYTQNGVLFNGAYEEGDKPLDTAKTYGADRALVGYRASYVTAYDNGAYGVYAFAARKGLIEHVLASGHPDSGIYVGQCKPCDVVVRDSVAERNAIGYYGTNASGGVVIMTSTFRRNRLGMAPNSQRMEKLAPQADTVLVGNLVEDNDDPATPIVAGGFFGTGIAVGGGTRNQVLRNRVRGHDGAGIALLTLNQFPPVGNRVEGNVLEGNGTDLVYGPDGSTEGRGNCFAGNRFTTSSPPAIESALPCASPVEGAVPGVVAFRSPAAPPPVDYRTIPAPGPQPSMPDAATAPGGGAGAVPPAVDLASVTVPA